MEEEKEKLSEFLQNECEHILKEKADIKVKLEKMNLLFNMKKILDNYDELEPILKKYFKEKSDKDKWEVK